MHSTACFSNPNTGSEGLAELSKVAVEQEGDAHLLRARTPTVIRNLIPSCRNENPSLSFRSNKERASSRAQLTRSGHVYVISNIGSFGEDVYKIGMTRRLEPMDRVRELGDASVPFHFDVHAIIYCEDAPQLENQLHREFHQRRVNQVNHRKEFFRVSLAEITTDVRQHHAEIEFTLAAEAVDYRKSQSLLATYSQPVA